MIPATISTPIATANTNVKTFKKYLSIIALRVILNMSLLTMATSVSITKTTTNISTTTTITTTITTTTTTTTTFTFNFNNISRIANHTSKRDISITPFANNALQPLSSQKSQLLPQKPPLLQRPALPAKPPLPQKTPQPQKSQPLSQKLPLPPKPPLPQKSQPQPQQSQPRSQKPPQPQKSQPLPQKSPLLQNTLLPQKPLLPPKSPLPQKSQSPPQKSQSLPQKSQPLPQKPPPLPQKSQSLPQKSQPLPQKSQPLPQKPPPLPQPMSLSSALQDVMPGSPLSRGATPEGYYCFQHVPATTNDNNGADGKEMISFVLGRKNVTVYTNVVLEMALTTSLMGIACAFLNSIMLIVILVIPALRTIHGIHFIASVNMSSIGLSIMVFSRSCIIITAGCEYQSHFVCITLETLYQFFLFANMYARALAGIDRFVYIIKGIKYNHIMTSMLIKACLACVWTGSGIYGAVFFAMNYNNYENSCFATEFGMINSIEAVVMIFLVPAVCILVVYTAIFQWALTQIIEIKTKEILIKNLLLMGASTKHCLEERAQHRRRRFDGDGRSLQDQVTVDCLTEVAKLECMYVDLSRNDLMEDRSTIGLMCRINNRDGREEREQASPLPSPAAAERTNMFAFSPHRFMKNLFKGADYSNRRSCVEVTESSVDAHWLDTHSREDIVHHRNQLESSVASSDMSIPTRLNTMTNAYSSHGLRQSFAVDAQESPGGSRKDQRSFRKIRQCFRCISRCCSRCVYCCYEGCKSDVFRFSRKSTRRRKARESYFDVTYYVEESSAAQTNSGPSLHGRVSSFMQRFNSMDRSAKKTYFTRISKEKALNRAVRRRFLCRVSKLLFVVTLTVVGNVGLWLPFALSHICISLKCAAIGYADLRGMYILGLISYISDPIVFGILNFPFRVILISKLESLCCISRQSGI